MQKCDQQALQSPPCNRKCHVIFGTCMVNFTPFNKGLVLLWDILRPFRLDFPLDYEKYQEWEATVEYKNCETKEGGYSIPRGSEVESTDLEDCGKHDFIEYRDPYSQDA